MTVGVMLITDGRGSCFERTICSLKDSWPDDVRMDKRVIVCDTLNRAYRSWLKTEYRDFDLLTSNVKLGFHGAIQLGWEAVKGCDYVFHLEDDFDLRPDLGSLPIASMIDVLQEAPWLAQVALKRQPWAEAEKQAGGIIEMWPDLYEDRSIAGYDVVVHKNFFTTNPSVYPKAIANRNWPQSSGSEAKFTQELLADGLQFAYWGKKFDPPRVEHIGDDRIGTGY